MKIPSWHPLSLKQKIILILICYAVAIAALGTVSFDDLNTVGRKLEVVELADNLNWVILEIRRYEKNYLLYRQQEDIAENRRYVDQALAAVEAIRPRVKNLRSQPQLNALSEAIIAYRDLMQRLSDAESKDTPQDQLVVQVRELGQYMLDLAEKEVAFERAMIRRILETLKVQLLSVFGVALALGAILPFLAFRKLFKLFNLLHRATEDIAGGRFGQIPVEASEIEMRQLMEAFNRMVEELQRHQTQLIQTQKLSSLGTMAAGVAHQLNNPLNNISTSCQIAMDELDDGDPAFIRKMMDNIDQETIRARDIVKGLLEFSRTKVFSQTRINLAELVKRALTLIGSQVPANIAITTAVPADVAVWVDAQRFQEVLLNLLTNAVQAIGDQPGTITVTAGMDLGAGQAVIRVADSGPGIDETILNRIFDPFFTTKHEGQGTGLGLAIVYGIIKQHRGTIAVESGPGRGTTFVIGLPLHEQPPASDLDNG